MTAVTFTYILRLFLHSASDCVLPHAEVSEALAEMQNCQSKLGKYEIEKTTLTLSLQQREAEISRLQEVIR